MANNSQEKICADEHGIFRYSDILVTLTDIDLNCLK